MGGEAAETLFECPVCSAQVDASATQCPGCGAQFAEETAVEKFECPLCGATVDGDAARCPSCGVEFEEEAAAEREIAAKAEAQRPVEGFRERPAPVSEPPAKTPAEGAEAFPVPTAPPVARVTAPVPDLKQRIVALRAKKVVPERLDSLDRKALYREMPRIVNEVKPLLLSAKTIGVDVEDSKRLINDAIAFGKKKEMEKAVKLVSEAKAALQKSFISELTNRLGSLLAEMEKARSSGSTVAPIEGTLDEALALLEKGNYPEAADKISFARDQFEALAGGYYKAKEAVRVAESLIDDSTGLGFDLESAKKALVLAKDALDRKRWKQTEIEASRAREYVMRELPQHLDKEMKRARNLLLDMKVKGGDLTKPIGILKQASIHLKREEYEDAAHFVRLFRQEIGLT